MKRFLAVLITAVLLLPLVSIGTFAAASIDVNGASSAYPGDEVTVTVKLDSDNVKNALAVQFDALFDAEQITYRSNSGVLSGWKVSTKELSEGAVRFLFECDEPTESIDGKTLIKIKFRLASSLAKGENVSVSLKNINIASMEEEQSISDVTYSVKITKKSSDATLYSLSVSDVTLSPAFASDVTSYTSTIDYRTTPLKVNCKATDSKASVKVSGGDSLKAGLNTVTITVTAEDGTTKKYTLKITMKENPNPESDDNAISKLEISTGTITPAFNPDVYNYTITVPEGTERITLSPTANDKNATVNKKVVDLSTEQTTVILSCTAENGSKRNYMFVIVKGGENAPAEDTESADVTVEETTPLEDTWEDTFVTDPIPDSVTSDVPKGESESADSVQDADTRPSYNEQTGINRPVPLWSLLLFSILSLILGAVISAFIFKRKF